MTESRTGKNTEVEMLPVEGLFKESAKYVYFVGATTKLCQCRCCRRCCFIFHIKNLSINLKSQLDTLADKHTNCSVTSLPVRNAKMP